METDSTFSSQVRNFFISVLSFLICEYIICFSLSDEVEAVYWYANILTASFVQEKSKNQCFL